MRTSSLAQPSVFMAQNSMFERLPSRVSIARASAKRASTMKSTITMTSRPTKVHESSSIPKDATSKDVNSGRRALLMAMPGMLVLPSMQAEAPARAAEAAVEASAPPPGLSKEMQQMEELLRAVTESRGGDGEEGGSGKGDDGLRNLGYIAILGLVLIPIVKLALGGGIALTSLKYLQRERRSQKKGGSLAELLGLESKDELSKINFKVERYNDMMASGAAAILEKTDSPAAAERLRDKERERKVTNGWGSLLGGVASDKRDKIMKALEKYYQEESERKQDYLAVRKEWRNTALSTDFSGFSTPLARANMEGLAADMYENEMRLYGVLKDNLSASELKGLVELLDSTDIPGIRPEALAQEREVVYVLDFVGDQGASQVAALSMEVTTLLDLPVKPKEVILKVTSPGGTVTGYGLAAAEMKRLTAAGIKLTVCIDQLAASGGYLMACHADKIICAPYAAVGSIGVVAQLPNVADRLEREGIEFITTTAGKWKRTVTPFNKPSEDDLAKQKEDIQMVYRQFADTVKTQRPHLVIDEVATGEVWYGTDALARGLVDELKTSADYILQRIRDGAELFSLKYSPKKESSLGSALSGSGSAALSELALALLQQNNAKKGGLAALGLNDITKGLGGVGSGYSQAEQLQFLSQEMLPTLESLPVETRMELAKALLKL